MQLKLRFSAIRNVGGLSPRVKSVLRIQDRPLLITLKEEAKKRELFQNLIKIRDAGELFSREIITHDLTKKQMVEQVKEKENEDQWGGGGNLCTK